jgi:hypothetical protein
MRATALGPLLLTTAAVSAVSACERHELHDAAVVRRYAATEARQGVAVDAEHFYAIDNAAIGKYRIETGALVARWTAAPEGLVAHLNSGVVEDGLLYSAHSNYPDTPMISSIEVFDTRRMEHVRSVPLPSGFGSATWTDRAGGAWWVTFAHYAGKGGEPGKGPEHTRLVKFDRDWRPLGEWSFPNEVVQRWAGMSSSGGVWANERRLYATGHHAPELYVLELPASGSELSLVRIIEVESEGQGIALDRGAGLLYSIQRRTREVLVSRLPPG